MKKGDTFPVNIAGIAVGQAVVEIIEDDIVTVFYPAQRVKFKTRTELTDEGPEKKEPETEHIVTGVDVRKPVEIDASQIRADNIGDSSISESQLNTGAVDVDKPETKTETVETKTDATEAVTGAPVESNV